MAIHEELEARLAKFKHTEAVLVFTGGFTANSGTIPAVVTDKDVIISDELNHASIIDGVRLSSARYKKSEGYVYAHKDMEADDHHRWRLQHGWRHCPIARHRHSRRKVQRVRDGR